MQDYAKDFSQICLLSFGQDGFVKELHINNNVSKDGIEIEASSKQVIIHDKKIISIAYNPEKHTIFTCHQNNEIHQYQFDETNKMHNLVRVFINNEIITSQIIFIQTSSLRRFLLSACNDFAIYIWDISKGTLIECLISTQKIHKTQIVSCRWNPEDTMLVSSDLVGLIVVWGSQFEILFTIESAYSNLFSLKFNPIDSISLYAICGDTGRMCCFKLAKEIIFNKITNQNYQNKQNNSTVPLIESAKLHCWFDSFDVDSRGVCLVCGDGVNNEIVFLNAATLERSHKIKFDVLDGSDHWIVAIAISRDARYVVTGNNGGFLSLYDTKKERYVFQNFNQHFKKIKALFINE